MINGRWDGTMGIGMGMNGHWDWDGHWDNGLGQWALGWDGMGWDWDGIGI